jgi:serine/threonine protein kinase
MYMLEELCTGGELWCKVKKDHVQFSEDDVKQVMRKTLSAICYMHEEGMCHRDLKLENFLLEYDSPDAEIKVSYHWLSFLCFASSRPIPIILHFDCDPLPCTKKICDLGMSLINNGKNMHQRSGTIE